MLSSNSGSQIYTPSAIDTVIARGKRADWIALKAAALAEPALIEEIIKVCSSRIANARTQRYSAWKEFAEKHLN